VAFIVVDERAENLIAVAPGANASVTPEAVETALSALAIGPGDVVLACREIPPPAVRTALGAARRAGAIGVLNPAPADGLDMATLELAGVDSHAGPPAGRCDAACLHALEPGTGAAAAERPLQVPPGRADTAWVRHCGG
jgi:hypothetical protein